MAYKEMSESLTDSQVEEELQERSGDSTPRLYPWSSKLRAVMRIRNKYQAMKRQRAEMQAKLDATNQASLFRAGGPEVFTFDEVVSPNSSALPHRRKKKRRTRVLFPNGSRKMASPPQEHSRAKPFLVLLSAIVFLQIYNAIENLDDHVQTYDLEGLEKTLQREVFGQRQAMKELVRQLHDYLSTYVHSGPLALSLHGPGGVGKSHVGRLLARHFRSVVGEQLVVQYYALHHCPLEEKAEQCAVALAAHVAEVVGQAEIEEKIPVFILDEVEFMHVPLLDALHRLLQPDQNNEFLNAVYVLISSHGGKEITRYVLQNSSSEQPPSTRRVRRELETLLRRYLQDLHPVWEAVHLIPLTLLEKKHVMECFLDEMTREGFYPDHTHIERLASELTYYSAGRHLYSHNGCKQVVAKVNLL